MGIEELVLPSMELTSDTIALMMLLVNVSTKSQCLIRVVLGPIQFGTNGDVLVGVNDAIIFGVNIQIISRYAK